MMCYWCEAEITEDWDMSDTITCKHCGAFHEVIDGRAFMRKSGDPELVALPF